MPNRRRVVLGCAAAMLMPSNPATGAVHIGHAAVDVLAIDGQFQICATGSVSSSAQVSGYWQLSIAGVRGTNLYTGTPIVVAGRSVDRCTSVTKAGTTIGAFTATLSFLSIQPDQAVAGASGGGYWSDITGDHGFGTSN